MGRWETFDHTADVGIRVTGTDLDDLFRTAAEAVFDYIVVNRADVRPILHEAVRIASDDTGDLLVTWLNELIFLSETRHLLFSVFEPHVSADRLSLFARVAGEPIDRGRHELDHEVKAVTRHGVELRALPAGVWEAEFILDI